MKIKHFFAASLVAATLFSCKKDYSSLLDTTGLSTAQETAGLSADATTVTTETEAVQDEATNTASIEFSGTVENESMLPIDKPFADADSTRVPLKKHCKKFDFKKMPRGCKTRSGSVQVELLNGNRWQDTGAVLHITFTNYKVENTCSNESVTINGERFITNVSGGNKFSLVSGKQQQLVQSIRTGAAGLQVIFTDTTGSKTANWNAARKNTVSFTKPSNTNVRGAFVSTLAGDTTLNGVSNVAGWGTTRNGKSYTTSFVNPMVWGNGCGGCIPSAGLVQHTVDGYTVTVLHGLDVNGNTVTNGCATHYKVTLPNGTSKLYRYK